MNRITGKIMSGITGEVNNYYGMDASLPSHPETFRGAAVSATDTDKAYFAHLDGNSALAIVDGTHQTGVDVCEPITEHPTLLTRVRQQTALAHAATATVLPLQVRGASYGDRDFSRPIGTEVDFGDEQEFTTYGISSASVHRRVSDTRDPLALQQYHTALVNETDDPRVLGTFEDKNKLSGEEARRRHTFMVTRRAIQDSLRGPLTTVTKDGKIVPIESDRPTISAQTAERAQTAILAELGIVHHELGPIRTPLELESGIKPASQSPTGKFEITSLPKVS